MMLTMSWTPFRTSLPPLGEEVFIIVERTIDTPSEENRGLTRTAKHIIRAKWTEVRDNAATFFDLQGYSITGELLGWCCTHEVDNYLP